MKVYSLQRNNFYFGRYQLAGLLSICFSVVAVYILGNYIDVKFVQIFSQLPPINVQSNVATNKFQQDLKRTLISVAEHLVKAHRYARSGKTIIEVAEAYQKLTGLLDAMHALDANSEIERALKLHSNIHFNPKNESMLLPLTPDSILDVCPEVYTNNKYGYPFYFKGFAMLDCDRYNVRPFSQVLSLLFDFTDEIDVSAAGPIFAGLNSSEYNRLPLIIAVQNRPHKNFIERELKAYNFSTAVFVYNTLMEALNAVSTEYILVSRDLVQFDWNSQLERLVRLISYKVADVVAGSHRTASGHWMSGCYQIGLRNYSLRLVEGYDLSYNACMYCDYSSGPFVMRSKLLNQLISHDLKGQNQYLDLMLTLRSKDYVMMTCPDSMFYTYSIGVQKLTSKLHWLPLVQKWELNRIVFPDNSDLLFTCNEAKMGCYKQQGYIVSVCCLADLTNMLNVALDLFTANNIPYELCSGSLLSVAKLENAFPWERDHDLTLMTRDLDAVMKLNDKVNPLGYKFVLDTTTSIKNCSTSIEQCVNATNVNCGYIAYRGPNWRIEFWGANCLSSHVIAPLNGTNSTLVRNAGHWVNVPSNPLQAARNEYAYQVLRHVEHWMTLGKNTGWIVYQAGKYSKCPKPGFHGCLDNFLPDGNLQFRDIWV